MPLGPLSVEQIDKRSSNIKHYKNPDGAFSAVISNGPIHYKTPQSNAWLNKRQQFAAGPGTNEWISNQSDVTMRTYQLGAGGNRTWWIQFTETLSGQGVEFQVLGQPSTTEGSNTLSFQDGASRTWTYTHTRSGGKMWGPPMDSTEPATTYTFNYRLLGGAPALSVTPEGDLVCGSIFRMPRSYMRGADGFNYPATAWEIGSGTVSFTMDHVAAGLPAEAYPFRLDPSTTFNVAVLGNDANAYRTGSAAWPPNTADTYLDNWATVYAAKEINGTYDIYCMLLKWNTAFIDDAATVTGATLQLTNTDEAGAFINTNSKTMSGGWYTGAFSAAGYTATAETDAFSGFNPFANTTGGVTVSIPLSNAATNVNKSSNTALRLHLSDGGTPTGRNVCGYASFDHATLNEPRLVVDYNLAGITQSIPAIAANDGHVLAQGGTWPQGTGTSLSMGATGAIVGKQFAAGPTYTEYVGLLRFDTSIIDDVASVLSAELQMYVTANSNPDAISVVGDYATLALSTADYARNIGTSAFNAVAIDSFATSAYNSVALKSPAANISKTGNTDIKIGSTNLASDAAPTGVSLLQFRTIEASSGATPPILAVTVRLPNLEIETFLIHATGTAATSAEGSERYDSTRDILQYHDGVREKATTEMGYMPYAYPIGGSSTLTTATNLSLASAQAVAMPVVLEGHMLLDGVSFWDVATGTARGPLEFGIYEERLNNSNTLDLVTGAVGSVAAYTPTVASLRTMAVTSPPVYLPPGCYWLVIKNNHASNGSQIAGALPGTMASNVAQTKVFTTTALASTLDFVAATWTKIGNVPGVRLNGRVFGQTTAF